MLRQEHGSLTAQLLRRVLILSVMAGLALIILLALVVHLTLSNAQRKLHDAGSDAARSFDLFLSGVESDLSGVGAATVYAENDSALFRYALDKYPAVFELLLVDPDGTILAARRRVGGSVPAQLEAQPWQEQNRARRPYFGPVDASEYGVPFMDLALPVFDAGGQFSGSLVARLDLTALWNDVNSVRIGEQGYVYIADANGLLLAYTDQALVVAGKTLPDLIGRTPQDIHGRGIPLYRGMDGKQVVAASTPLATVPWYTIAEQPLAEALRASFPFLITGLAALVLALILVTSITRFMRRQVAVPLREVLAGARIFGAGNLDHRLPVLGGLELRELSTTLNGMVSDLQQSRRAIEDMNRTLEQRVVERTRDVVTVTEVSSQTADILDVPQLLRAVSDLTKANFGLYHTHIYLLDDKGAMLVLAGGSGEVGRQLVAAGHRIPLSHPNSLVARAARTREVVAVDDVREAPDFLPNPLLPETRSELAVALTVRDRLLGVMDLQSETVGRFSPDTHPVMQTLARQVAAAISNARLFSIADTTSRHEQALSLVSQQIQSAVTIDEVLQTAVRELGKVLRVPHTAIELQLPPHPAPAAGAESRSDGLDAASDSD